MTAYTIPQYLLDRANVHDTVTRVPLYYDTHNIAGLVSDVYADEILIDYTSILGGTPYTLSRKDWVDKAEGIIKGFGPSQHVTTGIITDLPQPTPTATRPDKVVVHAQVSGNIVGKEAKDGIAPLTQNGGLLEAELVRYPELEKQGLNPWRISKYKVIKRWERGDTTVFDSARDE